MKLLNLFLLTICFIIALDCKSQNDQDYIIHINGDTLRGTIELLQPELSNESIILKTENNQRRISSNKFSRAFIDNTFYSSIRNGNKYQIMREIIPGYLGLYELRYENNIDLK